MSNDDDRLAEFDLSAWDAPPPPADLADAVIRRMAGTNVGAVVPVEEPHESRRTWLVAAVAVAAILLAIGVWSVIRGSQPAAPATGSVVAERARMLSLDTVDANLDAGADVRWQRKGSVLHVEQRAGNATWHVHDGEHLVIAAGAGLASVEATGANVRVEVQMNAMDARVIGASALTAAAVAMVTVVVYEGHVKVGRAGQPTVVVAPGSTYHVKPEQPAEPPAPVVGGTVDKAARGNKIAILGLELVRADAGDEHAPVVAQVLSSVMRTVAASEGSYQLAPNSDRDLVDEKLLNNCTNEAMPCMAAIGAQLGADMLVFGKVEPTRDSYVVTLKLLDVGKKDLRSSSWTIPSADAQGTGFDAWGKKMYLSLVDATATTATTATAPKDESLGRAAISKVMARIKRDVYACAERAKLGGKIKLRVQVSPDGSVRSAEVVDAGTEGLRACIVDVATKARFPATKTGGSFVYPFVLPDPPKPAKSCDATALKDQGMEHINLGAHAAALAKFEASLKCKPDPYVIQLAFMESCMSHNPAKAKHYYKKLSPAQQQKFGQICIRMKVDYQ